MSEEPKVVHPRMIVTAYAEVELNPENYKNVAWPPGSDDNLRDLTDPAEMMEYEKVGYEDGVVSIDDLFGGDAPDNPKVEFRLKDPEPTTATHDPAHPGDARVVGYIDGAGKVSYIDEPTA
jgi:hypothetical protein